MNITPLHEIRDENKLARITDNMRNNGWVGRPILVLDCGDHYQAITGSHRIVAAEETETQPETYVLEPALYDPDNQKIADLWEGLVVARDDYDRLEIIAELVSTGEVDKEAHEIMRTELEQGNS